MSNNPGGKGDARRPTDDDAYAEGYDRIFGRKPHDAPPEAPGE